MMKGYHIARPTQDDAIALATNVREDEVKELRLLYGMSVAEALDMALREAESFGGLFYALHGPCGVLGMGGAWPMNVLGTSAMPWFIGVDMAPHRRFVSKFSKAATRHFLSRFPVLTNVVGAWNTQTLAWLPYAGFTLSETPEEFYPGGPLIYRFWAVRQQKEQ